MEDRNFGVVESGSGSSDVMTVTREVTVVVDELPVINSFAAGETIDGGNEPGQSERQHR